MTLEALSITVAYLHDAAGSGTAFFVASGQPYLVTAAHVASGLDIKTAAMTFRMPNDVPESLTLRSLFPKVSSLPWVLHQEADVAVLRLPLSPATTPLFEGRFLTAEMVEVKELAPDRERTVTVMGFPLTLGTSGRFSPITGEAKPASGLLRIPRGDTATEATFFLLDRPSIGGFSGAPVYLRPAPYASGGALVFVESSTPTKCVGLVHGTIPDDTGGKLASIVPASFIHETIEKAKALEAGV